MLSPLDAWVKKKTGLVGDLSPQALEQWQFACLKKQLAYARANSPYYAKSLQGYDIDNIASREDLARLPLLSPKTLRRQPQDLATTSGSQVARITTLNTSGSSGDTKRIYFSEADLERTVEFFAFGMTTLIHPKQTTLILISDDKAHSLGDLLRRAHERIGARGIIHGPILDLAAAINAAKGADCLVGLPAQLNRLCLCAPQLRPQSVLLTADYVPEAISANLKRIWGSAVFSHYGLTESGFGLAVQCRAFQGHHLREAEFLTEIIDSQSGQPLPDGCFGELVLTSLVNQAMPLIRYRTGDITRRQKEPCPCGSRLTRLDKILGRAENAAQTISIHKLDQAMFSLPGLYDYQAELLSGDILRLKIDCPAPYQEDKIRKNLRQAGILPSSLEISYQNLPPFFSPAKRCLQSNSMEPKAN